MSGRFTDRQSQAGRGKGRNNGRGRGRGRGRGGRGRGGRGKNGGNDNGNGNGDGSGGRGYAGSRKGGNRDNGRNPNNGQDSRKFSRNATKSQTTALKNGEKGAEAHTVPESTRIKFTKILLDMRENPNMDRLEMSADLTNTERKFMHALCMQVGLKSKSTGKGDNRRIVVTKMSNGKKMAGVNSNGANDDGRIDDRSLPKISIGINGAQALQKYVQMFPPNEVEFAEATETGSSFSLNKSNDANKPQDSDGQEEGSDDKKLLDTLRKLNIDGKSRTPKPKRATKHVNLQKRVKLHQAAQDAKVKKSNYPQMVQMRSKLPAFQFQQSIVDTIQSARVTILSGDTGCGKSTQVPQFILDSDPSCNIAVTQPRRISAISIAERVAQERCEDVGRTVGYSVRLEGAKSESTQLMFLTPGVLLRRLQSSPDLAEFTHIIIDEIHERDKYTEFLMIALRELLDRRSDLRIVLMSATIQTNELRQYWNGAGAGDDEDLDKYIPAEINVPGRTFPVQSFFLEDVLSMTGTVSDAKFGGELNDLENDLSALLSSKKVPSSIPQSHGKKKKSTNNDVIVSDDSFVCVMCNQGGFKCAEELGSHMGICTGIDTMNMVDLENKVKRTNVFTLGSANEDQIPESEDSTSIDYEDDYDIDIKDEEDDDDDHFGMHEGKWDGESPFAVADVIESSTKTTLTEDEMLNRYQMMHDDELIDSDLILETIRYICKSSYLDGAILVFLPGWQEISDLAYLLESTHPFNNQNQFSILPLHSGIPSKEQRLVFQRPKTGVRKIVLSTNIAETSVTIDDVAFVLDSGRAKEKNYDPHLKTATLQPMWISKASAKQRRGRAGRTKAGVCFHLFSRRRHDSFRDFLESELLRTSLEEICLQCKKLDLAPGGPGDDDGIPAFLAAALTPPHQLSVTNALEKLVELGAMEAETNDLTQLGQHLSCLSVSPEVGKMIFWSYILGCSKDTSSMAVAMSYKNPFIIPPSNMRREADEARVELSQGSESDQVLVLNVLQDRDNFYKRGRKNQFFGYCRRNFINFATIQMIADLRSNIARELTGLGFPDPSALRDWHNRNSANERSLPLLQSSIIAGVYPNVATRQEGAANFSTSTNRKCKIHVGSVNACKGQPLSRKSKMLEFIAYGEMVKGSALYTMNQTTHLASIIPIMLLCGSFHIRPAYAYTKEGEREETSYAVMSVDEWISFQCDKDIASSLTILRKRLDALFNHIISNPKINFDDFNGMEKMTFNVLDAVIQSSFHASPGRW